ncbi:MAG: dicarboxylate/amino acid:cation symporter [Alistipes sp.]|nr:dicarboxylate/amino acid:cation symporter [Alistipes sp.]
MKLKKKLPLYIVILLGMAGGVALGFAAVQTGHETVVTHWVKPWGTIFIRLLRLIAIPLVVVSLINGITNLDNVKHLSRLGLRTLWLYLITTVAAIFIGLTVVNLIQPGNVFPREKTEVFRNRYEQSVAQRETDAQALQQQGPLDAVVNLVPENVLQAASDNTAMMQLILLSIAFGVAMVAVGSTICAPIKQLINALNDVILKLVQYIMRFAPLGVFALMADLVVSFAGDADLILALGYYALTVILGLSIILFIAYPLIVKFLSHTPLKAFLHAVFPVQLLAVTSCSSAACLPLNIAQMQRLGLPNNVISFVLPTGTTINMNGTSCYHAIATVFVAQVMGIDLSLAQMLSIVLLTTVSSIGTPGIPSGGMAVLMLVLVSVGIPAEGIALIIAMDRPLDMLITAVNVSGDAMAACVVSTKEPQTVEPQA